MRLLTLFFCLTATTAFAQQCQPGCLPQSNTATIDPDGTARITRVIPVPTTISPEARKFLARRPGQGTKSLEENRRNTDAFRKGRSEEAKKLYPVNVEQK